MALDVSIGWAFLGGAISFVSPCVLPLVPPYLCFLTGTTLEQLTGQDDQLKISHRRILMPAMAFVAGFSTVFIVLGATASIFGRLLRQALTWTVSLGEYEISALAALAGLLIIVMGLHFLGAFRLRMLDRDTRYQHGTRPAGLIGAYMIGVAFAFGWTPCIGPVLAAILALAGTEENVARGAFLLAVYSAGLGVPFILAALGINRFLTFFKSFRAHFGKVEKVMGGMLVATGVLFITGGMQTFAYWLIELFPALATIG